MKINIHFPILCRALGVMAVLWMPHLAMASESFDGEWKIEDSANNGGAAPESCQINLWGRVFMFTKEGKVIDLDYGWVGHLQE